MMTKKKAKLKAMEEAIAAALQRWIVAGEHLEALLKRKEQFLRKNSKKGRIR